MLEDDISSRYPLHYAVWTRNYGLLIDALEKRPAVDIDLMDPRGRTALMLAVTLDQEEMARELLKRGADADTQNKDMWSVSHEAIATGNGQLAKEVIMHRDYQRSQRVAVDMRQHLEKLRESPDFYAEMSWEFASWVPFVSKLCPSDTYKIWKRGSSLRIDTTLVGFEGHSWQRGNQSFIFRLQDDSTPQLVLIDHEAGSATIQSLAPEEGLAYFEPTEDATYLRMTSPISTTYIDIEKIGFERSKGGILSWIGASEKREKVAGYDCKVFNASNVEVVSKTRSEHLSEADRARLKQDESSHPLSSILNMVRTETGGVEGTAEHAGEPDLKEYFDESANLKRDIGRQRNVVRKSNSFKATLWLAEQYPLCLQEQVAPIVNLMSSSSAHFSRLNTFMRMQLPAGFPVKIEIPLFHVVSAKITFGRINEPGPFVTPLPTGTATPSLAAADSVDGVPLLTAEGANPEVEIDPKVFDIPADYRTLDDRSSSMLWWPDEDGEHSGAPGASPRYTPHASRYSAQQQEDMLLQLAIEQSLLENAGSSADAADVSALAGLPTQAVPPRRAAVSFADEDQMLELAIRRSLEEQQGGPSTSSSSAPHGVVPEVTITPVPEGVAGYIAVDEYLRTHDVPAPPAYMSVHEEEMALALRMSLEAAEEDERKRRQRREGAVSPEEEDDDEVMRRILELSMTEK